MPKTNEMLLILKGFQYATSLDLNMGCYHIQLRKNASNLCMIIPQWVEIPLQASNNGSCKLTRHFPS